MVILDTNIIIDHLRRSDSSNSILMDLASKYPKGELGISVITIQELYEGRSTLDSKKEEYLLAVISPLTIIQYNYETAKLAGQIARDLNKPIELGDAAIAATCIINNAELVTLNIKDFNKIDGLQLLELNLES